MKCLPLAAALLVSAAFAGAPLRAAVLAADASLADWRSPPLPDAMRQALSGAGYGLTDDGRVLDPKTREALTPDQLAAALARIGLETQRLALERLRLILAHQPQTDQDRADAAALKGNLPDDVVKALDGGADLARLRSVADGDLSRLVAFFDGSRTQADRQAAAEPVRAGDPGPRAPLPYFSDAERRLGDSLRAAAAADIARDPYGRKVLARLNGPGDKPDLPPMVVGDLGGNVAEYDYRRRALVVDRETLLSSIADGVAGKDRGALEKSLASQNALTAYLNAHPAAVAAFASRNDVLLVHELTHAWQDRRDPVMQEMARGSLPAAVVIDYEAEAWMTKNQYLLSKLKSAPATVGNDPELDDARRMLSDPDTWLQDLRATYDGAASNAMPLDTVHALQAHRLEMARARPVSTREEQTAKALDVAALTRAQAELASTQAAERARVADLRGAAVKAQDGAPALLANYYLNQALDAEKQVDFAVNISKADDYAAQSGDAKLLARVRAAKGRRR
jgi:hypothetical protein